jgi:hypothetical protein
MNGNMIILGHCDGLSTSSNTHGELAFLTTALHHVSTHLVHTRPLSSGRTFTVDGELWVCAGPLLQAPNEQKGKRFEPVCLQYKVKDSGVHLFAKGFSTTVL